MNAKRRAVRAIGAILTIAGAVLVAVGDVRPAAAAPALTIAPVTWNVAGLDSNNVDVGPNTFPVGARVCNTGPDPATNLVVSFVWDSANAFINLEGPATVTRATLAAGACTDVLYHVVVTRDSAVYLTARGYHITASADGATAVSTPVPREMFVEQLISQNRNQVASISGPTALIIGDVVTFVVDASTAPGGYDQLETFLALPSSVFEFVSIRATYEAPAGGTNDTVYADACGWDHDPTSGTYRTCVGPFNYAGGKAGGGVRMEYTVRAVGAGTVPLTATIYDRSGSSYHYNSDLGAAPNLLVVTVSQPATTTTTTTTTAAPGSPTTTASPASAGTPTTVARRAVVGLPATGSEVQPWTVGGAGLVALGALVLIVVARLRRPLPPSRLVLAADVLRWTLAEHPDDPGAGSVRRLLAAVDRVAASLGHSR